MTSLVSRKDETYYKAIVAETYRGRLCSLAMAGTVD